MQRKIFPGPEVGVSLISSQNMKAQGNVKSERQAGEPDPLGALGCGKEFGFYS